MSTRTMSAAILALAAFVANAKTLVWYSPVNVEAGTEYTSASVIDNLVDPGTHDGTVVKGVSWDWSGSFNGLVAVSNTVDATTDFQVFDPVNRTVKSNATAYYINGKNGGVGVASATSDLNLQSFTIEMFIRSDSAQNTSPSFLSRAYAYPYTDRYNCTNSVAIKCDWGSASTGLRQYYLCSDGNGGQIYVKSANAVWRKVWDSQWHHIAITVDQTTRKAKLYYDYNCVDTLDLPGDIVYNNAETFQFGDMKNVYGGAYYYGIMAHMRISDTVLTEKQMLRRKLVPTTPKTLVWYHPEGVAAGTEYTAASIIANKIQSGAYDGTVVKGVSWDWSGSFNGLVAVSNTVDFATGYKVYDPRSGEAIANDAGYFINGKNGGVGVNYTGDELNLQSFTIEMFIRSDSAQNTSPSFLSRAYAYPYTDRYNCTNSVAIKCDWGSASTGLRQYYLCSDGNGGQIYVKSANAVWKKIWDLGWHHIAITVDELTRKAKLYYDYNCVDTLDLPGDIVYSNAETFQFGDMKNVYGGSYYYGIMTHMRIVNMALPPEQMLHRKVVQEDGDAALCLTCDGTLDSSVLPNQFVTTRQTDGTFSFSDRVWGLGVEEASGAKVRDQNLAALAFDSGIVKYGSSVAIDACDNSLTVEFFFRSEGSSFANYSRFLAYNRNQYMANWSIGAGDNGRNLRLTFNTCDLDWDVPAGTPGYNVALQVNESTHGLFDGKWHHVAMTCEPYNDTNTLVKLYTDYDPTPLATKELYHKFRFSSSADRSRAGLEIGNTNTPGGFKIDEVRISKGVLPVSRFLKATKRGMVMIVR